MSAAVEIARLVATILIAVTGLLTALNGTIKELRRWRRSRAAGRPTDRPTQARWISRFIGRAGNLRVVAGVALVALALVIFRLTNHGAPAAGVSISSPRSGDRVAARSTDVEGQSSHLGSHEIWIYVQSHAKPPLYPQPGPAQKLAGGMWSARAYFLYGERRDAPVDILAVVATPSADRTIARYFAERETRSGIGRFKALPPGAEIKDRITVTPSAQSTNTECAHAEIRTGSVEGRAEITTLGNRSIVRRAVDPLEGADRGLAPATRLWVFVYSPVVQRFYPQSSGVAEPAVLHDVRFHSAAFFGGQPGEHYDVAAVLATESASRALSRTLLRWARAGDYVGLTAGELPVGLEEKHCVPVVLRP